MKAEEALLQPGSSSFPDKLRLLSSAPLRALRLTNLGGLLLESSISLRCYSLDRVEDDVPNASLSSISLPSPDWTRGETICWIGQRSLDLSFRKPTLPRTSIPYVSAVSALLVRFRCLVCFGANSDESQMWLREIATLATRPTQPWCRCSPTSLSSSLAAALVVTHMLLKTTYKAVNTSVCLLRRRRQRKKPVAAANDEEDIFRSLGDDLKANQRSSQR